MFDFSPETIQRAIVATPVFLLAITVHEFAHARTALGYGDSTAHDLGRTSLNPMVHLDLMGTLMFFLSGFRFGWAKPVPVNPFNLRNPRIADIWISAAGPLSNFGLATIAAIIIHVVNFIGTPIPEVFGRFLFMSVQINIWLGLFNLIPLFPLDGSHIVRNLIPQKHANTMEQIERYSPYILLLGLFTGIFGMVISPFVRAFYFVLGF